jgi:hypothetical protein
MTSDEDFREDIRQVVRRHDPDPEQLRSLAGDLEKRAERVELTEEVI